MTITVNVKWGKQIFKGVEIDTSKSPEVFKEQLFSLSTVTPDRQKVMIPRSGQLKDNTTWDAYKIKDGMTIMLIGSVGDIKAPETKTVFIEDLPNQDAVLLDHPLGLINTGNTCYLNSSIQALSVVPALRDTLINYSQQADGREQLPKLLGTLIHFLKRKEAPFMPLSLFLTEFRRRFPQFAEQSPNGGGFMQQDAEEAFSILLQSMQDVPGAKEGSKSIIDDLFQGEFLITSKCVESPEEAEEVAIEPFKKLSVHIEADTSFLQSAIKNRMVEHITKTSPSLGAQAVYEKATKISKLPLYLNLQFVRFFWRQDKNLRAKICKPVEFPFRLDLFEFCTADLQQRLAPNRALVQEAEDAILKQTKRTKKGAAAPSAKDEDVQMEEPAEDLIHQENDTGLYDLVAVVSHQGRTADGGHYVAWVKQTEEQWLLYDDDRVTPVPVEDIKKLTGHGGADWHIAYLCVYGSMPLKSFTRQVKAEEVVDEPAASE